MARRTPSRKTSKLKTLTGTGTTRPQKKRTRKITTAGSETTSKSAQLFVQEPAEQVINQKIMQAKQANTKASRPTFWIVAATMATSGGVAISLGGWQIAVVIHVINLLALLWYHHKEL